MKWWAYKHVNGSYHLKLCMNEVDIDEARKSSFVERIVGPYYATNRGEANMRMLELLKKLRMLELLKKS